MANIEKLLTYADLQDPFSGFKNDKERIKYMTKHYSGMNLTKAFGIFYGYEFDDSLKQNKSINRVITIQVGKVYTGTVKEFTGDKMTFDIPGVKEEIIVKDNFSSCVDEVNNYLMNHDNKLIFEVREFKNGKYYVSVINAYYNLWKQRIEKAMKNEDGIEVYIESLTKGGYLCSTPIFDLCQLTGKNYTSSVFIPGSNIVLNIERDFEKWIGQKVIAVPQKFMEFKTIGYGDDRLIENSLVCSRKRVLQIQGMVNMHQIYQNAQLANNPNVTYTPETFDGTVTGIINSNNKTGIFIELNDKYITGLLPIDATDLLNYKPGDPVKVKIKEFEVQEGKEPFVYNRKQSTVVRCNVRPVFELA